MTLPTNSGEPVRIRLYANTEPMLSKALIEFPLFAFSRQCVETIQEEPKLKFTYYTFLQPKC